jgi:hypothetical protein
MTAYDTAARPTWREEARRDREARARLGIERDAARRAARAAERDAADARRAKLAAARRAARAEAADALGTWVSDHVTDLLFVPVIGVPAALAWTAMASYGAHLYGTPGRALPAFSEGAMWAFAAATTINRHRHPDRPVWHLRMGTLVFALFGAVLNFAHGFTLGGIVTGVVMALVSVAGVTAHQLTKAGPQHARRGRRTRAERDADRIARLAAKRVRKAREEAVKAAAVELGTDGTARLVYAAPAAPADTAEVPEADTPPAEAAAARPRTRQAADKTAGRGGDTAAAIARLRAKHPGISTADIAARLGISPRTVRRYPPATQTRA